MKGIFNCLGLLSAILISLGNVYAQVPGFPVGPSMEAAAMPTLQETPVDLFTGIPQISIPIRLIEGYELKHNISLAYHPHGLKVNSDAGSVGLGWSLQAGGVITRTMHGLPDEKSGLGYLTAESLIPEQGGAVNPNALNYATLRLAAEGLLDLEPDVFNVVAPGLSCRLVFDKDEQLGAMVPVPIPYSSLVINEKYDAGGIVGWTITNTDGIIYHFGTVPGRTAIETSFPPGGQSGSAPFHSAWYLLKMVSPGRTDSIEFHYDINCISKTVVSNAVQSFPLSGCQSSGLFSDQSIYNTESRRLSRIVWAGGKAEFKYHTQRLDLPYPESMLDSVIFYGRFGSRIRAFALYHSYFDSGGCTAMEIHRCRRLRLDSMAEFDALGNSLPPFRLQYNPGALPPKDSKAIDHWGYYNAALSNQTLIPAFNDGPVQNQGANREADPAAIRHAVIEKMTVPTGGIMHYEWEANDYRLSAADSADKVGGGLRIRSITSDDGIGEPYRKSFIYKNADGHSSGVLLHGNPVYHYITYVPTFISTQTGLPILNGVCSYLNLMSSDQIRAGSFSEAPVVYGTVKEVIGVDGKFGTVESRFSMVPEDVVAHYPFPPGGSRSFQRGLLASRIVKNRNGTLRQEEVYQYSLQPAPLNSGQHKVNGIKVAWLEKSIGPAHDRFQVAAYQYDLGYMRLDSMVLKEYEDPGVNALTMSKRFHYKPSMHLKEESVTSYLPEGKREIQRFIYTEDLLPPSAVLANSCSLLLQRDSLLIPRISQLGSLLQAPNGVIDTFALQQSAAILSAMALEHNQLFQNLSLRLPRRRISFQASGDAQVAAKTLLAGNVLGKIWLEENSVIGTNSEQIKSSNLFEYRQFAPSVVRLSAIRTLNRPSLYNSVPALAVSFGQPGLSTPGREFAEIARVLGYDSHGRMLKASEPDERILLSVYSPSGTSPGLILRGLEGHAFVQSFDGTEYAASTVPASLRTGLGADTAYNCQLAAFTIPVVPSGTYRMVFRYRNMGSAVQVSGNGLPIHYDTLGTEGNSWYWCEAAITLTGSSALTWSGNCLLDDVILTRMDNRIEYRKYNETGQVLIELIDGKPLRTNTFDGFGRLISSRDSEDRVRAGWEYRMGGK